MKAHCCDGKGTCAWSASPTRRSSRLDDASEGDATFKAKKIECTKVILKP